jgi:BRCT domain type II-containing protein
MVTKQEKSRIQENRQGTVPTVVRRASSTTTNKRSPRTSAAGSAVSASDKEKVLRALDEIGEALREQGLTLEDMIERGREIRGQLIEELYGIKVDEDTT